jgi:hypothetical protein
MKLAAPKLLEESLLHADGDARRPRLAAAAVRLRGSKPQHPVGDREAVLAAAADYVEAIAHGAAGARRGNRDDAALVVDLRRAHRLGGASVPSQPPELGANALSLSLADLFAVLVRVVELDPRTRSRRVGRPLVQSSTRALVAC